MNRLRSTATAAVVLALMAGLTPAVPAARAAATGGVEAYRALGVDSADVLSGTVLNARVLPGDPKQVVAVVSYLTGSRTEEDAVNVRLGVFDRRGERLAPVYTRDLGDEREGGVAGADLQLVDLDLDGINEIVVSWDSYAEPLVSQRISEVIVHGDGGFRTAWSGAVEYDATREARKVPPERRDRWRREIDIPATLATRGETLVFQRHVLAVAGERLASPETVRETFPLRAGGGG